MEYPINLPAPVQQVMQQLNAAGYEAFIVGGCVRDQLLQIEPKDWDVTTNALPEQIQQVFPKSLYLNTFGTVTVRSTAKREGEVESMEIEVTTYRADGEYNDHRHPDQVQFGVSLQEDLERRDFTINAMAYTNADGTSTIIDPFAGQVDLQAKRIKAVGDSTKRFQEDALRMLRAIRFAAQLGFTIEAATWQAIIDQRELITHVSAERIRDELIKMLQTDRSITALWLLRESGLLQYILPELEEGTGVEQNLHHIYSVFFHNVAAMQFCPSDEWQVRLAALLHDVGKPRVKEGSGKYSTFHQHENVGAKMTRDIMKRLAFSKADTQRVVHLVRHHMFFSDTEELTDAGVRRLLQRVGKEHIQDLIAVRVADRMGSGVFKEKPYRLLELEKRIEYVQQDPISTSTLAIDGNILMAEYGFKAGPHVGVLLHRLLDEVMEDPTRNTEEYLRQRAAELAPAIQSVPEADARAIMKQYRDQLNDLNSYKG